MPAGCRVERSGRRRLDDARHGLLRGCFHGADDDDLALHAIGVSVVALRRAGGGAREPLPGEHLAGGDTLVLSGAPEPLALAEGKLLGAG